MQISLNHPVFLEMHAKNMKDPIYREGYESCDSKNPYKFPMNLNLACIRVSNREPFTKRDGEILERLNKIFENTYWERWESGDFNKVTEKLF